MNQRFRYEFFDASCILLINSQGMIRKLFTPFQVTCILPVGVFTEGTKGTVEEVGVGTGNEIRYIIQNREYLHSHFMINIKF